VRLLPEGEIVRGHKPDTGANAHWGQEATDTRKMRVAAQTMAKPTARHMAESTHSLLLMWPHQRTMAALRSHVGWPLSCFSPTLARAVCAHRPKKEEEKQKIATNKAHSAHVE
jgi:hypothetical protein